MDRLPTQQALIANESFIVSYWSQLLLQARQLNRTAVRVPPCFDAISVMDSQYPVAIAAYQQHVSELQGACLMLVWRGWACLRRSRRHHFEVSLRCAAQQTFPG